jgi:PAS domain S-box-containing protein
VNTHTIIAANPEAQRMTGFSEAEMTGHLCHKFICPAEEGKCPIGDLGLKVDRAERVLMSRDGSKVPVLKTVTEMQVGREKYYIENFIDMTQLKDAENTLLAYFRESTLRIRNPIELVRDNLQELKDELKGRDANPAYLATSLAIQEKNMDDILNNLQGLEQAVAEKRTEIPDALREYLKR